MKNMNFLQKKFRIFSAGVALMFFSSLLSAQGLDPATIANPPADSWPSYHGDYSGRRHTSLTQITPQNVGSLSLAWAFQAGQTGSTESIKSSPLMVNGVIYFTMPNHVWAVDARTGHQVWHYTYKQNNGLTLGQRGAAIYKDSVFSMTPDGHVISLDAKTGTLRWDVEVGSLAKGYWSSVAPLVIRDHVIVGVGGDLDNITGYVRSVNAVTGKTEWQFDTTPPAGTPNMTTGGMIWVTGTYDPDLNLLYMGTGNPTPVLNGRARPGDNLYTCSIVALNPDTGKLVWAFQPSPHDTHDWDAVEIPVLVDADFHGQPRKMLMQSSRNGYFFVLDRTDGKNLLTDTFAPANWATGLDKKGQPIPNPDKEPAPDGRLIAPDEGGATNFRSPSFDPKTGLFIVSARDSWSIYFSKPADGAYGWAGGDYGLWSKGMIKAIDYQTGKIRWTHDVTEGRGAGVLTTASGITFTGDSRGNVIALDTTDGKTLWHAGTGGDIASSPISYELDGRQYVLTSAGSMMFAWKVPDGK
jgi:alcohol dehydrogenase (cytochrome c)